MATRSLGQAIETRPRPTARVRWAACRLWLYGLGMLIPAAYFARRYPLRGNSEHLLDIGKLARYQTAEFVWFCLGLAAMFLCYLLAARECRRLPAATAYPTVFGVGAVLAASFAWMYPVNAVDLYIYAVRSRLWTVYGENPNAVQPVAHWDTDPYVRYGMWEWANEVSPYGPLWNLVAAPATLIGGDDITVALVVFKALCVIAVLLGALVIARTLVATRPADAPAGALIYLWNPLVLWEGIGNGHNDVIVALPLLLAMWAWTRRRYPLVIPLLVVAALLKYVTVLLLPIAAIALWRVTATWRQRLRIALQSGAFAILAGLIAFWPFYDLDAVLASIRRQGEFVSTSPAAMIAGLLDSVPADPQVRERVQAVCVTLFLVAFGWHLWRVWKCPSRIGRASAEVLFAFLLLATWHFRAWYLIWLVALVALLPLGWPFARITLWSVSSLAAYGIYIWIWDWWAVPWETIRNTGVLVTFLPPLLATIAAAGLGSWQRRRDRNNRPPLPAHTISPGGTS